MGQARTRELPREDMHICPRARYLTHTGYLIEWLIKDHNQINQRQLELEEESRIILQSPLC